MLLRFLYFYRPYVLPATNNCTYSAAAAAVLTAAVEQLQVNRQAAITRQEGIDVSSSMVDRSVVQINRGINCSAVLCSALQPAQFDEPFSFVSFSFYYCVFYFQLVVVVVGAAGAGAACRKCKNPNDQDPTSKQASRQAGKQPQQQT